MEQQLETLKRGFKSLPREGNLACEQEIQPTASHLLTGALPAACLTNKETFPLFRRMNNLFMKINKPSTEFDLATFLP